MTAAYQSLDEYRERNAIARGMTHASIAWGAVLVTGLLAAGWFLYLVATAFARWFAV
jgi:hypothetical protein